MQVGVGYCDNPDSALAGRLAAKQALATVGRTETCDLVLLFCTARHDQRALRREVAKVTSNHNRIYGGGAVGIVSNENLGYAGDQVGVACIWLDENKYNIVCQGGLSKDGEFSVGRALGEKLVRKVMAQDSPIILFYDAVNEVGGSRARLAMATWLLEGIEEKAEQLPTIIGAGLIGDHILTPTQQFLGDKMDRHHAVALSFSGDLHIDHLVLSPYYPASPYYTVTKADGPVILEINNKPALAFLDEVLGSSMKPEEYPFLLSFGINCGESRGKYNRGNYVCRLCQGIDRKLGSVIMFEPDMTVGTRFQIMSRESKLDYIYPRVKKLLSELDNREPVFAFYLVCAGRCAGFGGIDLEDAGVIQDIVGDRFPLLGVYTGGEIAPVGGKPRGLDWTGVFCVFSKGDNGPACKKDLWRVTDYRTAGDLPEKPEGLSYNQVERLCVRNLSRVLSLDAQNTAIRNELEQKRRSFSLLSELSVSVKEIPRPENMFFTTTKRINAALNMQKTVLLLPTVDGKYTPSVLQGYSEEEKAKLAGTLLSVDKKLLDSLTPVLVTSEDDPDSFPELKKRLGLPYFISTPIVVDNEIYGLLITGRMTEAPPFLPQLNVGEAETLQAVSYLLASTMVYERLEEATRRAETDVLTGLYNRGAHERKVTMMLKQDYPENTMSAFVLIDLDYLKDINDNYGHLAGDSVLKALAKTLRDSFRATDVIARFGGDEFVVFCPNLRGIEGIELKVKKLVYEWSRKPHYTEEGKEFYSTLSAGISIAPRDGTTYRELLFKSDIALYYTKKKIRNGYSIYKE